MKSGMRWLLMASALLFSLQVGCSTKEDPTKREGFTDTSDPGNFGALNMKPLENNPKPEEPPSN